MTDNAFSQGLIPSKEISISFAPSNSTSPVANGHLTFGGIDTSAFTGELTKVYVLARLPHSQPG